MPSDQSVGSSALQHTQTWLLTQRQVAAGHGYPEETHRVKSSPPSTSDGVLLFAVRLHKYVKKILFLYSHKTQLNIKLSLLQHYNNMFRPKLAAIFRLYMKPI